MLSIYQVFCCNFFPKRWRCIQPIRKRKQWNFAWEFYLLICWCWSLSSSYWGTTLTSGCSAVAVWAPGISVLLAGPLVWCWTSCAATADSHGGHKKSIATSARTARRYISVVTPALNKIYFFELSFCFRNMCSLLWATRYISYVSKATN